MKIVVRGTNWIGDAVMSMPALMELRRIFPDAYISLHTRSWAEALFRNWDFIDDIITYEPARWAVQDVRSNSAFLRNDTYDLAILLSNSFESALTVMLAGIPNRIGYNRDLRGLLLSHPIPVPEWKNRVHEVNYYVHLIGETEKAVLGTKTVSGTPPTPSIKPSSEDLSLARKMLAAGGVDMGRDFVALGPGSTNSVAKRWPAERYAHLADRLYRELNATPVLIGSKNEKDVADQVKRFSKAPLVDLTGTTDLATATAVISMAALMICNDMGLAHVAPAVGTRTLVIFGPTNHVTTAPYSDLAEVLRKGVSCSPCMLRECPIDHRCMEWISVDEVFAVAEKNLMKKVEAEYEAGSVH
jgi:heptosyltransferase II